MRNDMKDFIRKVKYFFLWCLIIYYCSFVIVTLSSETDTDEASIDPIFHYKDSNSIASVVGLQWWPTLGDDTNLHVIYTEADDPPKLGEHCGGRLDKTRWNKLTINPLFEWTKAEQDFVNETRYKEASISAGVMLSSKKNSNRLPAFNLQLSYYQSNLSCVYHVNNMDHPNVQLTLDNNATLGLHKSNVALFRVDDTLYRTMLLYHASSSNGNTTTFEVGYYKDENTAEKELKELKETSAFTTKTKVLESRKYLNIRAKSVPWTNIYCLNHLNCLIIAQLVEYQRGSNKAIEDNGLYYSIAEFTPIVNDFEHNTFGFEIPIGQGRRVETHWQKADYGHSLSYILVTEYNDEFLGIGFGDDTKNVLPTSDYSFCRRYLTSIRKIVVYPTHILQLPWMGMHKEVENQNENFGTTFTINTTTTSLLTNEYYPFIRNLNWNKNHGAVIKLFFSSDSLSFSEAGYEIVLRDKKNPNTKNVVLSFNPSLNQRLGQLEWCINRTNAAPAEMDHLVSVAKISEYHRSIEANVHILLDNSGLIEVFFENGFYVFTIPINMTLNDINEIAIRGLGSHKVYLMSFEVVKYITKSTEALSKVVPPWFTEKDINRFIPDNSDYRKVENLSLYKNYYIYFSFVIFTLLFLIL